MKRQLLASSFLVFDQGDWLRGRRGFRSGFFAEDDKEFLTEMKAAHPVGEAPFGFWGGDGSYLWAVRVGAVSARAWSMVR